MPACLEARVRGRCDKLPGVGSFGGLICFLRVRVILCTKCSFVRSTFVC